MTVTWDRLNSYVNRKNELDLFWKWDNNIPGAGRNSLALSIVIRQRVGA